MCSRVFIIWLLTFSLLGSAWAVINKTFPSDFRFGTATAAYQIEGGWDADGKGENIWDRLTHFHPDLIADGSNGDIACDSYNKYLEDVALLKNLGVYHYRISLSWSRILPSGTINNVNKAGVTYYRNLLEALKENDIEPMVTLFHWDLPQPLQDLGGFPNPLLAEYFADYARLVFSLYGDLVKYWFTFNEPKQTCLSGYGDGSFAPAIKANGIGEYLCAHTVLKAHARAYHIYDEEFRSTQQGKISYVVDTTWMEPASENEKDIEAAERTMQFNFGWYAHAVYHPEGNYPQIMIDRIAERSKLEGFPKSRLPNFTEEEVEYIVGTYDFFSLNTYTTILVEWKEDEPIGSSSFSKDLGVINYYNESWGDSASSWLKVVPWGTRKLLNWIDQEYDHPEIIITENGFSDTGELDDGRRVNFYREYLSAILEAIVEDNINVTGYTAWSLIDNFEWMRGYTEKFGLHHVDFDSPNRTRTIKSSGEYYKKVIATKCLVDKCE